jgi:hypothetical protein
VPRGRLGVSPGDYSLEGRTSNFRQSVGARAKIAALFYASGTQGEPPTSGKVLEPEQKLLRLFMRLARKVDNQPPTKCWCQSKNCCAFFMRLARKVDNQLPTKCWCQSKNCCAIYWSGTQGGQPTSDKVLVPEQKLLRNLLVWHARY